MTSWPVDKYLLLANIIQCTRAEEGTNFEIDRLMTLITAAGFDISAEGLRGILSRSSCFGGRGPQKQRGCPLLENEKCTLIPSTTWSHRK